MQFPHRGCVRTLRTFYVYATAMEIVRPVRPVANGRRGSNNALQPLKGPIFADYLRH